MHRRIMLVFRLYCLYLPFSDPSEPYWCDDLHNYPDLVKLSEPFPILELNLMDKRMLQEFNKPKATFLNLKVIKDGQLHAIVVHWQYGCLYICLILFFLAQTWVLVYC